jgi:hypothetical protein
MNRSSFTFRAFSRIGEGLLTANLTHNVVWGQEHLVPVLEAIGNALADNQGNETFLLSIDGTEPFAVEFRGIGDGLAMAQISRGTTEAVLIVVADAAGDTDASVIRSLRDRMAEAYRDVSMVAAVDWLTGCTPPLAAVMYVNGESDIGLNSLAMCFASCWLRLHEG